jgi:CheY-like chemotaxis protein
MQDQKPDTITVKERETKDPLLKRILVVDDEPDVTLTFKVGLEGYHYGNHDDDNSNKTRFEVYTYNNPSEALSEFRSNFYDLMLVDVYMPDMNGFQLSEKILDLDVNINVCCMSSAEINIEALREVYPKLGFGCFMKKPVTIEYLVKRLLAELD